MKIVVYYKEQFGCDLLGHFEEHWEKNDKLHPDVKKIPIEKHKVLADEGIAVMTTGLSHTVLTELKGREGLRLDVLQTRILELLKEKS